MLQVILQHHQQSGHQLANSYCQHEMGWKTYHSQQSRLVHAIYTCPHNLYNCKISPPKMKQCYIRSLSPSRLHPSRSNKKYAEWHLYQCKFINYQTTLSPVLGFGSPRTLRMCNKAQVNWYYSHSSRWYIAGTISLTFIKQKKLRTHKLSSTNAAYEHPKQGNNFNQEFYLVCDCQNNKVHETVDKILAREELNPLDLATVNIKEI